MTPFSTCISLLVTFMVSIKSGQADTTSPSSWAKLQISPDTLASMEHGGFLIDIYRHTDNHKASTPPNLHKYFYAPIALLDNKRATSSFNNVTQKAEMRFRIEMWNQEVQNKVVQYIGQVLGHEVNSHQVQIIPLENVILASTSSSTIYTLSTDWKPCRQHQSLWFALTCFDIEDCNQLAANMRSNPEQFDHFKLLFSLSSQTSKTKETTIRIENIVHGQMASALQQRFGNDKDVFLTANDEKRLVTETATNIFVESFDDSDVVSQNSETQLYNVLKNLLVSSRTTIKEQSDKMWESVFWNEDNYRPDKTSKTLNEIYRKLDTEKQKKMADSYQKSTKVGGKVETKILKIFSAGGEFNKEFADQGMTTKEELDKFYYESKDHVVWNGEKFTPKPLALGRINLSRLQDTQSLKDRKVSVRYTTAVLSTPINFVQNAELTTTDEWQILKDQVKEIRERLTFAIANLTALTKNTTTPTTIGRMPESCADLRLIGHLRNGFYSVKGTERLESVYCDFTNQGSNEDEGLQKWLGFIDVKTSPLYYTKTYGPATSLIELISDNYFFHKIVEDSLAYAIITRAPTPGKYFFALTGQCKIIVKSIVLQYEKSNIWYNADGIQCGGKESFFLKDILKLDKDSQVRLAADVKGSEQTARESFIIVRFFNVAFIQLEEDIFPLSE